VVFEKRQRQAPKRKSALHGGEDNPGRLRDGHLVPQTPWIGGGLLGFPNSSQRQYVGAIAVCNRAEFRLPRVLGRLIAGDG
jgi:hypothetical protein